MSKSLSEPSDPITQSRSRSGRLRPPGGRSRRLAIAASALAIAAGTTTLLGPGTGVAKSSGSPRSQARLSKSPNTWQVAHAESP